LNEEVVIRGLLTRDEYQRYVPSLKSLKGLEREHRQIISAIGKYWEEYPEASQLTPDELVLYFNRLNPALKDGGLYDEILCRIRDIDLTNPLLLADEMRMLVEGQFAGEILKLALMKVEGQKATVMAEIKAQLEAFEAATGKLEEDDGVLPAIPLKDLLAMQKGPYKWRYPWLQQQLGNPPLGQLGHIYAYSNTGKTTFGVYEAVNFAYQMRGTEDVVLYMNNEESVSRTRLRAICSFTGKTAEWLGRPENEAELISLEQTYLRDVEPHLRFVDGVNHVSQVERHLKRFKPKVAFIDQGPKVALQTAETGPAAKALLYNWYREAAKTADALLITLGQADATARDKQYLTLGHMDGSKVGIPGELDFAIGISAPEDPQQQWVRYFSITKTKFGQPGHYRGSIDPLNARYK
jgi:hypothetical protein